MCWQALAFAGANVVLSAGQERVNAVLHFQGRAHHHHVEQGSIHQEWSADSNRHAVDDACAHAPSLVPPAAALPVLKLRPCAPPDIIRHEPLPPFLRGIERPPRSIA